MKIEIGESLGYSFLRHVKQCWLVQTNWKVSEHWTKLKSDDELHSMFQSMKEKFDPDGSVFKQTKDASQLLKQGEIDVVGVQQDGSIHALDVAFHEKGLNYGGGADKRVLKKLLRALMILEAYQPAGTELHLYFCSPKVWPRVQEPLELVFNELRLEYPNIGWHLLTNDIFADEVVGPTLEKAGSVADTSELFVRAAKLQELAGMVQGPAVASVSNRGTSAKDLRQKADGLAPSGRGRFGRERKDNVQICVQALAQHGYTRTGPSDHQGADFMAYHRGGSSAIKVRVTTRVDIRRHVLDQDIHMSFPVHSRWYLVPHDELVRIAGETTPWLSSNSWVKQGGYSSGKPSKAMLVRLEQFAL